MKEHSDHNNILGGPGCQECAKHIQEKQDALWKELENTFSRQADLVVIKLRWTTKTPTMPGWYWFHRAAKVTEVAKVYLRQDNQLRCRFCADQIDYPVDLIGEWAGPIPEPEA